MIRRPVRRLALVTCAVLAAGTLSSCATFSDNDVVARVGDEELTADDLSAILESPITPLVVGETVADGSFSGDNVRALVGVWVTLRVVDGAGLLDADMKEEARSAISEQFPDEWKDSAAEMQEILVLSGVARVQSQQGTLTEEQLRGEAADAEIYVNPFYGRWSLDDLDVVGYEPAV